MKVPKFMRQEKLSFSATKKIDCSPFHTPQMTQWKTTTNATTSSIENKNSLDIIYNLTTTINVPKVALSPNSIIKNMKSNSARYTKSAQPKRLKRNKLVLSGKLKNEKMETPVKAYLRARDSMLIPQKQLFKDEEMVSVFIFFKKKCLFVNNFKCFNSFSYKLPLITKVLRELLIEISKILWFYTKN
jgi:hypothetical protein